MDWLIPLEEKVRAAAERIRELQDDKRSLESRVVSLEKQLAASAAPADPGDPHAARWEEEKREIRDRVERLTRHLEELAGPLTP